MDRTAVLNKLNEAFKRLVMKFSQNYEPDPFEIFFYLLKSLQ